MNGHKRVGVLSSLAGFFGGRRISQPSKPTRNRTTPRHVQDEIMKAARAKRQRKMERDSLCNGTTGWYNG